MKPEAADRGAHGHIEFQVCARGFLLSSGDRFMGSMGQLYAFDRIEDVAAWFIEQYAPLPDDGPQNEEAA